MTGCRLGPHRCALIPEICVIYVFADALTVRHPALHVTLCYGGEREGQRVPAADARAWPPTTAGLGT